MSHKKIFFRSVILFFLLLPCIAPAQSTAITGSNGKIQFTSEAPMELIKASSDKLKGAIDPSKNTYAFAVEMNSFKGFNGDLQREHFHENYMETEKFPRATFAGKFIEQVAFSVDGTYEVRAKGFLTVHGVQKERIIKGTLVVKNGALQIKSSFTVLLEDHDIKVPKIVYEKIAEEIKVNISMEFKP